MSIDDTPILRGGLLALAAAIAFGVTIPLVDVLGKGSDALPIATLLYLGAAIVSVPGSRRTDREAPIRRAHVVRIVAVAGLGAFVAPFLLVWGLQRTTAANASLLLNFETFFTVALGVLLYREHLGARVLAALGCMAAGGVCLVIGGFDERALSLLGAGAVVLATLAWSFDNALTRPLADLDPTAVVLWKSAVGAAFGLTASIATAGRFPALARSLGLLACGALGYGVSLRLYLGAQRRMGAARTASVFATAPFLGFIVAIAAGRGHASPGALAAAVLFAVGIQVHLTERHAHAHSHAALEHEHAHRHDDGHHEHLHAEKVVGTHSHVHRHEPKTHRHPHADDIHHRHTH
ncbi:MAG: EamA family transporter [Polyangiaceae bacterium]